MDALRVTPLVDGRLANLAGRSFPHSREAIGGISQCCAIRRVVEMPSSDRRIAEGHQFECEHKVS
jgi:hypothetical protein